MEFETQTENAAVVDLSRVVSGMERALGAGAVLSRFDLGREVPVMLASLYPHGLFYATDAGPMGQHWLAYDRIEVRPPDRVVFYRADGRRVACLSPGPGPDPEVSPDVMDDLRTLADEWAAHRALHDGWG